MLRRWSHVLAGSQMLAPVTRTGPGRSRSGVCGMVVGGERHQSTELVATIRCAQPDRHRPWTAGLPRTAWRASRHLNVGRDVTHIRTASDRGLSRADRRSRLSPSQWAATCGASPALVRARVKFPNRKAITCPSTSLSSPGPAPDVRRCSPAGCARSLGRTGAAASYQTTALLLGLA